MFPHIFALTSEVPDLELEIFVHDSLDVEADGWNGGDYLAEFELVKDGRFTCGVQTDHQNAHLLLPEETSEQGRYCQAHNRR